MDPQPKRFRFLRALARPLLAGVLALFPLALTIGVVIWLGGIVSKFLGPGSTVGKVVREVGLNFVTSEVTAYLIGMALALGLIYFLGILVEAGMKNRWQAFIDVLLKKVPLVNTIYNGAKRVAALIEPREQLEMQSMTPVLVSLGGAGGTVFPAFMPTGDVVAVEGLDYRIVMIPTAPIPFGGALMCVPIDWVKPMKGGIDGLLNIYISMGVAAPEYLDPGGKTRTPKSDSADGPRSEEEPPEDGEDPPGSGNGNPRD